MPGLRHQGTFSQYCGVTASSSDAPHRTSCRRVQYGCSSPRAPGIGPQGKQVFRFELVDALTGDALGTADLSAKMSKKKRAFWTVGRGGFLGLSVNVSYVVAGKQMH